MLSKITFKVFHTDIENSESNTFSLKKVSFFDSEEKEIDSIEEKVFGIGTGLKYIMDKKPDNYKYLDTIL